MYSQNGYNFENLVKYCWTKTRDDIQKYPEKSFYFETNTILKSGRQECWKFWNLSRPNYCDTNVKSYAGRFGRRDTALGATKAKDGDTWNTHPVAERAIHSTWRSEVTPSRALGLPRWLGNSVTGSAYLYARTLLCVLRRSGSVALRGAILD